MKRATLLAQGSFITPVELALDTVEQTPAPSIALHDEADEKRRILNALQQTNNNKSKAATLLGIDRKTLYNKLKLHNLPTWSVEFFHTSFHTFHTFPHAFTMHKIYFHLLINKL